MRVIRLSIATCLLTALPGLAVGQEDVLVPSDATYDYLLTIKDVGGVGLAIDPTADPTFAFVDPDNPTSNIAIWPYPDYPIDTVNGVVRDTGASESIDWQQASGPFSYGNVNGITTGTDILQDGLGGAFGEADLDGQKVTQYFRTSFTTTEDLSTVLLDVLIDDGAVFYVDGEEVARYNCCFTPDGTTQELSVAEGGGAPYFDSVTNNDANIASEDTRNSAWGNTPYAIDLSSLGGVLSAGEHVLAASVHSYGAFNSSDMGFDARLITVSGDYEWAGPSGSWTNVDNWTSSLLVPNAVDAVANLLQMPSAETTAYHNGGVTMGTLHIDNANKYAIAGLGTFTFDVSEGDALIEVASGDHEFQAPVAINDNTNVNVASGASLEFNNDLRLNGHNLVLGGNGTVSVNNAVFADGGAVAAAAGAVVGGGTIHGDFRNAGATVSPGSDVGVLTVEGDFTQSDDATIQIDLASLAEHDRLVVDGKIQFDGKLIVAPVDGFTPQIGDEFPAFSFDSSAGTFDEIVATDGSIFEVNYSTGTLMAVPEPTSVWMLGVGMGAICLLRRRS